MNKLNSINDAKELVLSVSQNAKGMSFGDEQLKFCQQLSQLLLSKLSIRKDSELVALGFWCRSSNLLKLKQHYSNSKHILSPRGLAFHITPGNVETMFAYSWLLSMLMGNKNIVRLSNRGGDVLNTLLNIIDNILDKKEFTQLRQTNQFIQYDYDTELTDYFSKYCDIRVIWGGDQTINKIRMSPILAKTREIVFADRFSFSLIDADSIITLNDTNNKRLCLLANDFCKDVLLYGQQACSSPRLIIWHGSDSNKIEEAKKIFWYHINNTLSSNTNDLATPTEVSNKMIHAQFFATEGLGIVLTSAPHIYRIQLDSFKELYQKNHCGSGLVFELNISKLDELSEITNNSFQTCSYYGIEKNRIKDLVRKGIIHDVLRFVPIGQALNFDHYWDGMDLFSEFSMRVNIS